MTRNKETYYIIIFKLEAQVWRNIRSHFIDLVYSLESRYSYSHIILQATSLLYTISYEVNVEISIFIFSQRFLSVDVALYTINITLGFHNV